MQTSNQKRETTVSPVSLDTTQRGNYDQAAIIYSVYVGLVFYFTLYYY